MRRPIRKMLRVCVFIGLLGASTEFIVRVQLPTPTSTLTNEIGGIISFSPETIALDGRSSLRNMLTKTNTSIMNYERILPFKILVCESIFETVL
jgi:hypothetical protein